MKIGLTLLFHLVLLFVWHLLTPMQVSLTLFLWLVSQFFLAASRKIVIPELISLLAVFQWLIGPVIYYSDLNPGMVFKFSIMQVESEVYFNYAIPATILFSLGLNLFRYEEFNVQSILKNVLENNNATLRHSSQFMIIGAIMGAISGFVPLSISMYVIMLSYLLHIGVLINLVNYILTKNRRNLRNFIFGFFYLIIQSFTNLMFGELIFFTALSLVILLPILKISILKKVLGALILTILVVSIQLIKIPARSFSKANNNDYNLIELIKFVNKEDILSYKNLNSDEFLGYSIARFNQGSIVSHVMSNVPDRVPHANGSTLLGAVVGSFIPRIIWPSKPQQGIELYKRYTMLPAKGVSFGISQLGEAYANFGRKGGIIFMLFLGAFYSLVFYKIHEKSTLNPIIILFIPIIFMHGIKVETDLARTLGFIIRVVIFFSILNFFLKRIFNRSIW